ncbi:CBS domain-containing protein [Microbispora sp. GKU 823]|uniref:CBS domain-containing protein n=1 Tax=Microbispora sp. GKU 823 TaxID=1652100 RepID=UPI00269A0B9F|nr:CBS domain-containing protein [Microbispora sp. GKU 823]
MNMKVQDVMTTDVASVHAGTPFRDIAEVLITHAVGAVPVVDGDGRVLGVVSEADLLRKEEFREQYYREGYRPPLRARLRARLGQEGGARTKAAGETAADLMTSPRRHGHRRHDHGRGGPPDGRARGQAAAVVDAEGRLRGIVSRHDLLKTFVRADREIEREVRVEILGRSLWADTSKVGVHVHQGVVTLTGEMDRHSAARVAVRMTRRVSGVVDVVDELRWKEDDTPTWSGG